LMLAVPIAALSAADAAIVRDLPRGLHVPEQAIAGPTFDVDRATAAWLDTLSPEQRSLSDAYFEGGYWLRLWHFVYEGLGVLAILLLTGFSRRMRDLAERTSKRPLINVAIHGALFGVATFVLGSVVITLLYAGIRRAGARWWLWATGGAFLLSLFLTMIQPVFVAPLFNDYKPLAEGPTRDALLSLARANEIPTQHLEWFDASKQTTRISANVSGMFGVTRISLNDNLLNRTSLPEIKAVLGHEMGHYVLNHLF